jgi:hypothetical protein
VTTNRSRLVSQILTGEVAPPLLFGLRELRLGDLVAIVDADNSFGRVYRSGAVTIGVVAHGMSYIADHGPGVTTILTSASGAIEPCIDAGANLATILGLR